MKRGPALGLVYGQRAAGLAAAALLAGLFAVALSDLRAGAGGAALKPAVGPWGGWSTAQAGVAAQSRAVEDGAACGWRVTSRTLGALHPVLPCGAKLFIDYGGTRALTRVVGRGPVPQGRAFDLTPALAKRLHLRGVREIRWAYAR